MEKDNKGIPYKQKKDTLKNVRRAWIYLRGKGYNELQTASIVGNLMQESYKHLDTNAKSSVGAYGIAQWLGSRKEGLFKFAKEKNTDPSDFDTQMEYLLYELETTEKKAKRKLQDIKNLADGAELFAKYYERPGKNELNLDRRVKNAYDVYNMYAVNPIPTPEFANNQYDYSPDYIKDTENINHLLKDGIPTNPTHTNILKDKLNTLKKKKDVIPINLNNNILNKEILKEKLKYAQYKKEMILDTINGLNLEYVKPNRSDL